MAKHQCVQFGVCPRADRSECFEVDADFTCSRTPEDPDCRSKLEELKGGGGGKGLLLKAGVPAALLAVGVGLFFIFGESAKPTPSPASTPPTVDELLKEVWPWLR